MSRDRIQEAAVLLALGILAAIAVAALAAGSPLRIAGGIVLLLVLPWFAASRLAPLRGDLSGGRLSAAGALAFALIVLLGLLLSATDIGITTNRLLAGTLIVTAVLAVLGTPGERPSSATVAHLPSPLGLALLAVAVAISVFAFVLARDRALTQAREETSYAAFLIGDGERLSVGLRNSTDRTARFTVRDLRRPDADAIAVDVPRRETRVIPGFVAKPPPLRPRQRLNPAPSRPVEIRVDVNVGGRKLGRPLMLSTFAP